VSNVTVRCRYPIGLAGMQKLWAVVLSARLADGGGGHSPSPSSIYGLMLENSAMEGQMTLHLERLSEFWNPIKIRPLSRIGDCRECSDAVQANGLRIPRR
jgi:hypothetical protein